MVPVSQGEQVAGFRRYGFVGRVTLGGMVAVLVAASATLSGCVSNSEGSSAVAAPGSAVEDALEWDKVELTLVNTSRQPFTASATVNCTDPESHDVGPGESWTFSPSSCSGTDVKGDVTLDDSTYSFDDLSFTADNPWMGNVGVGFTSQLSNAYLYPSRDSFKESKGVGNWTVKGISYEQGNQWKITVSLEYNGDDESG